MTSLDITLSPTQNSTSDFSGTFILSSDLCHGFWYSLSLIVPSVIFVVYLAINARKNLKKLSNGRWHSVMIAYYALLWFATLLNITWCCLQAWQCTPDKEVAWNLLSLFSTSTMLCLEMSLLGFLLQENYTTGLDSLARTFTISGFAVSLDALLKAIYVFGLHVPMFADTARTTHPAKWALLIVHRLLVTTVYGYILFIHYSKWREKLPRWFPILVFPDLLFIFLHLVNILDNHAYIFSYTAKPAFYRYVVIMFTLNMVAVLSCVLAGLGVGLGLRLYDFTVICYHSVYLPFLYVTFLSDFFQEEDLHLDNAYYSEMRDAGFFDEDWE